MPHIPLRLTSLTPRTPHTSQDRTSPAHTSQAHTSQARVTHLAPFTFHRLTPHTTGSQARTTHRIPLTSSRHSTPHATPTHLSPPLRTPRPTTPLHATPRHATPRHPMQRGYRGVGHSIFSGIYTIRPTLNANTRRHFYAFQLYFRNASVQDMGTLAGA